MVIVIDTDNPVEIGDHTIVNRNVLCAHPIADSFLFQFEGETEFYGEQWEYTSNGDEIMITSQRELDAHTPYGGRCLVELMQYVRTRKAICRCIYVDDLGVCYPCSVDVDRDFNMLRIFTNLDGSVVPYHKYYQSLSEEWSDDNDVATSLFHNRTVGRMVIIVSICVLLALALGQLFLYLIPIVFPTL